MNELMYGGLGIGDAARMDDEENIPVLFLLDVVDRRLETGPMVEEQTGRIQVLVARHDLVSLLCGERPKGLTLLCRGG